jgi:hypothetical protein
MSTSYPPQVPFPYSGDDLLTDAYQRGWSNGHGLACHNVPRLGEELFTESMGRVTVTAENIREVHQDSCYAAESNSRCYSPFEFTAHEFNESEFSEDLWEAFEAGTSDAIAADLADYTDLDYDIEPETESETGES